MQVWQMVNTSVIECSIIHSIDSRLRISTRKMRTKPMLPISNRLLFPVFMYVYVVSHVSSQIIQWMSNNLYIFNKQKVECVRDDWLLQEIGVPFFQHCGGNYSVALPILDQQTKVWFFSSLCSAARCQGQIEHIDGIKLCSLFPLTTPTSTYHITQWTSHHPRSRTKSVDT